MRLARQSGMGTLLFGRAVVAASQNRVQQLRPPSISPRELHVLIMIFISNGERTQRHYE